MSHRPIIGVIPLWDDKKSSIWMLPCYLELIKQAGGVPIILPLDDDESSLMSICGLCSGFLLTGGHDVNPIIYHDYVSDKCGAVNHVRDAMEAFVFDYALKRDLPVLGICRGIQLINALMGGTLYQDLPSECPSCVTHQMRAPYDRVAHRVDIISHTPLSEIVVTSSLGVNSYHHQAIKELAPQLRAMAISDDGLIEAVYVPTKSFIQAYQWHPELNFRVEPTSLEIAQRFIVACKMAQLND